MIDFEPGSENHKSNQGKGTTPPEPAVKNRRASDVGLLTDPGPRSACALRLLRPRAVFTTIVLAIINLLTSIPAVAGTGRHIVRYGCTTQSTEQMSTRRSAAASSDDPPAKTQRTEEVESVLDALEGGRALKASHNRMVTELQAASSSTFIDRCSITCGEGEDRCFVLSEVDHISRFLPPDIVREAHCTLVEWSFVKLLPPDWYYIVFLDTSSRRYRTVPEAKLCLDGYPPAVTKGGDPENAAGFKTKKDLRLVFRPNALRFFWLRLHEPLRAAWPTVPQIMRRGYLLAPAGRAEFGARLNAAAPSSDGVTASAWRDSFRAALRERHWPVSDGAPQQAPPTAAAPAATVDLLLTIRQVARSIDPSAEDTLAAYRAALAAAAHPELTPDRIDRLADRLADHTCEACGSLEDGSSIWYEPVCGCGEEMSEESFRRADLCPTCEQDPRTSELRCKWCNTTMHDWRRQGLSPRELATSACDACHADGATPRGCECGCIEEARRRAAAEATAARRAAAAAEASSDGEEEGEEEGDGEAEEAAPAPAKTRAPGTCVCQGRCGKAVVWQPSPDGLNCWRHHYCRSCIPAKLRAATSSPTCEMCQMLDGDGRPASPPPDTDGRVLTEREVYYTRGGMLLRRHLEFAYGRGSRRFDEVLARITKPTQ